MSHLCLRYFSYFLSRLKLLKGWLFLNTFFTVQSNFHINRNATCNPKILSPPLLSCVSMVHHDRIFQRGRRNSSLTLSTLWLPLFLQKKILYLKGMLHRRSTELKTDIENNLYCSSKCVLETATKTKQCFYVHTNCIKTS